MRPSRRAGDFRQRLGRQFEPERQEAIVRAFGWVWRVRSHLAPVGGRHAPELRHIRLGGHSGRKNQLLRPERNLLAIAVDDDCPFFLGIVPFGVLGRCTGPVIQLHDDLSGADSCNRGQGSACP